MERIQKRSYKAMKVRCSHCEKNTWIMDPRFESTCRSCGNVLPPNPKPMERAVRPVHDPSKPARVPDDVLEIIAPPDDLSPIEEDLIVPPELIVGDDDND